MPTTYPIIKGNQYFDATTYTGNGGTQSIVNAGGFSPDFAWIKMRSGTDFHILQDSVRGVGKNLNTNNTNAETGNSGDLITSFNSNGFTVNNTYLGGANTSTNGNGSTYVGWQWRASDSAPVTNNAGTITSSVSANTTAGFSVVTYTGTGANATVGHGLGAVPKMIIVKNRNNARLWPVYHASIGATNRLVLNDSIASAADSGTWNNTEPTSTVFTIGTSSATNNSGSDTYVAYCWSEVPGFSKFGSYVGNGSADGPFIYTGFEPRYFLLKNTSRANTRWIVMDTARDPSNEAYKVLAPNTSGAEDTSTSYWLLDFLSNGVKLRYGADTEFNNSGDTYIYMAFAEMPFKYSNAR
jgi:hypothetical protein